MRMSNLRKEYRGEEVALVADVDSVNFVGDGASNNNTIWVSVPKEYEKYLAIDRYDGFLVALLYPAMAYKEDIEIDGLVSKRLLRNINKFIQDILLAFNPNKLHRVNITTKEVKSEILPTAKHIGTGFSGGIDSFATVYDNFVLEEDSEYKIDTLVCLNVGSHGSIHDQRTKELFKNRYNFLKKYADTVNLPLIPVDSNIHYYHHEYGHLKACILTLVSGILAIQGMFAKYYMASVGLDYNGWINEGAKYIDYSLQEVFEPCLLPLLSTETTEFILDGIQYTRVQKTINISKYPLTKQFLDVCNVNEPQKKNCGICSKCARVGLTLSAVNQLDDYKEVFDIETYKKNEYRLMYEASFYYKSNPFMRNIVDFAKENGKKYPNRFVSFPAYIVVFAVFVFRYIQRKGARKFIRVIIYKIFGKKYT